MSLVTPPRLMRKLLNRMFPSDQMEEIEGDLAEDFHHNLQQYGTVKAKIFYLLDVIKLVRLYVLHTRVFQ